MSDELSQRRRLDAKTPIHPSRLVVNRETGVLASSSADARGLDANGHTMAATKAATSLSSNFRDAKCTE